MQNLRPKHPIWGKFKDNIKIVSIHDFFCGEFAPVRENAVGSL